MLANDGAGADLAVVGGACVVAVATVPVATSSDDTGPILAFVGVLLVAFLTAYFARRRLDKQLRAEAERHDANLAAERERLTRQLRHDRHLDHIDAMRKVLIDAAEHLERFQFGMSHLERDPEQPAIGKFDPGGEFERALEEFQVIGTRLRLFFERAAMWSSRSRR